MKGKITCDDLEQFIKLCAGFAREQVCFEANGGELTIELTGGY